MNPRRLVRRLIRAARPRKIPLQEELRSAWLQGYGLQTILDVGANEGQFATWARQGFPTARILSFEPLPDCFELLKTRFAGDAQFEAFPFALGAESGEATIFRNEYSPSSSILPLAEVHKTSFPYAVQGSELKIEVKKLDDVLAGRELRGPVLLKIDVQGFEKQVLAGATKTLASVDLLLVEMSLEPLYAGEPLFDELYREIYAAGFSLRGILDMLRRSSDRRPLQVDALFERRK
jgi:FkbM family methyltransferase